MYKIWFAEFFSPIVFYFKGTGTSLLLLVVVTGLIGCDSDSDSSPVSLTLPADFRSVRSVNADNLSASVSINGNAAIQAVCGNGTVCSLPALNRTEFSDTNTLFVSWSEQVDGQSLLLAEFNGSFTVGSSAVVSPTGNFTTEGSRFDSDSDGFGNLAERNANPVSDPFNPSSFPSGLTTDTDGDGIADVSDNCVNVSNSNQFDWDGDGNGNECDPLTWAFWSGVRAECRSGVAFFRFQNDPWVMTDSPPADFVKSPAQAPDQTLVDAGGGIDCLCSYAEGADGLLYGTSGGRSTDTLEVRYSTEVNAVVYTNTARREDTASRDEFLCDYSP